MYIHQNQRLKCVISFFLAARLGCLACIKLNLLGQAIAWCDVGLAVSFDYSFSCKSIFSVQGEHEDKKSLVVPPDSNTFSNWRRTCHVSWVKTF